MGRKCFVEAVGGLLCDDVRGILRRPLRPSLARVVKLVDTGDLKSPARIERAGSSPAPGTTR